MSDSTPSVSNIERLNRLRRCGQETKDGPPRGVDLGVGCHRLRIKTSVKGDLMGYVLYADAYIYILRIYIYIYIYMLQYLYMYNIYHYLIYM